MRGKRLHEQLLVWPAILNVVLAVGCSTSAHYSMLVPTHTPKPSDCAIEVFKTGLPSKKFIRISRLDVHRERTYYGRTGLDDVLDELKEQACASGADAVIEIDERSNNINLHETNIYHVTATGIQYSE